MDDEQTTPSMPSMPSTPSNVIPFPSLASLRIVLSDDVAAERAAQMMKADEIEWGYR